jgi:hypothetical protein
MLFIDPGGSSLILRFYPAFDFLKDPEEDIYSINDGKPFNDKK